MLSVDTHVRFVPKADITLDVRKVPKTDITLDVRKVPKADITKDRSEDQCARARWSR